MSGSLYGTAYQGGANGQGTVFKITTGGVFTTLYSFSALSSNQTNVDGAGPASALIQGTDGNLYGSTTSAGASDTGTVFMITTSGVLTTLHSFSGSDGGRPLAALIQGTDGNLYGTTLGGANGQGTVFKITTGGVLTTLLSFTGPQDGMVPVSPLLQANDSYFYGTTIGGGTDGVGTIYKVAPDGVVTPLYTFSGPDGAFPEAALIQGIDGNFYGTTASGGSGSWGTVFKITTGGVLTTLYSFSGSLIDGAAPVAALVQGKDGNLYGTTFEGGANGTSSLGTVFGITTSGVLTTLHSFSGSDGAYPYADLVQGTDGNLYGTTGWGGANGDGIVFKITTDGAFTSLYSFSGAYSNVNTFFGLYDYYNVTAFSNVANFDGANPLGLIQGKDGNLYGTTEYGGEYGQGTVFSFSLTGPDIASLSPNSTHATSALTLTINGSGFVNNSVVKWNGHILQTKLVNANQLTATVTAVINPPLSAYPGSAQITVTNPGKATGNAFLTIAAPAPALKTLAPSSLPAGSKASTIMLTGQYFAPGAVVNWNATALATTYVSAGKLSATIPAADLTSPGTAQVSVTDANGGGTGNSLTFTIAGVPKLTLTVGTLSRDGSGNILAPVTLNNVGTAAADTLQVTSSTLGIYGTTSSVPISLGSVGAGSSVGTTLTYSGSAGTKGQKLKLTIWGSYQAVGSSKVTNYSLSANVVLP